MQNLLQSLHGRVFSDSLVGTQPFAFDAIANYFEWHKHFPNVALHPQSHTTLQCFLNPFMFFKHFMWLWTSWKCHQRTTGKFNWHRWCCLCFTCRKGTSHVVTAFITAQATASAEGGGVVQDLPRRNVLPQVSMQNHHLQPMIKTMDISSKICTLENLIGLGGFVGCLFLLEIRWNGEWLGRWLSRHERFERIAGPKAGGKLKIEYDFSC